MLFSRVKVLVDLLRYMLWSWSLRKGRNDRLARENERYFRSNWFIRLARPPLSGRLEPETNVSTEQERERGLRPMSSY